LIASTGDLALPRQRNTKESFYRKFAEFTFRTVGDQCSRGQVSVGAQVALNGASASGDWVTVLGLVDIFYDNIFPALGSNPF
jgi:hypothetical protein